MVECYRIEILPIMIEYSSKNFTSSYCFVFNLYFFKNDFKLISLLYLIKVNLPFEYFR